MILFLLRCVTRCISPPTPPDRDLLPLLRSSCLLPLFSSYLLRTSLFYIMKNRDLYLTLFSIIDVICQLPSLASLFCPSDSLNSTDNDIPCSSPTNPSLYNMISSLRHIADSTVQRVSLFYASIVFACYHLLFFCRSNRQCTDGLIQ